MKLQESLRAILLAKGWSASTLGRKAGVGKSTVSDALAGAKVSFDVLTKLARALEVSIHRLAYGVEDPFTSNERESLMPLFGEEEIVVKLYKVVKRNLKERP
jgi:transcriptional regulator with XRE-family HTH domain